jgi:hypothetical protein
MYLLFDILKYCYCFYATIIILGSLIFSESEDLEKASDAKEIIEVHIKIKEHYVKYVGYRDPSKTLLEIIEAEETELLYPTRYGLRDQKDEVKKYIKGIKDGEESIFSVTVHDCSGPFLCRINEFGYLCGHGEPLKGNTSLSELLQGPYHVRQEPCPEIFKKKYSQRYKNYIQNSQCVDYRIR